MWSLGGKKARSSEGCGEVFWMQRGRAQEMGVPTKETKEKRRSGTAVKSIRKGKGTQWSKGAAPRGSGNVYRGVNYTQRSDDICGV